MNLSMILFASTADVYFATYRPLIDISLMGE